MEHDGIGSDQGVVTDPEGSEQFGTGPDQDIVAKCRVALAFVLAGAAKRRVVEDRAIVANLGGLTDDDTHAMVDEKAVADFSARVNLDPGPHAANLGNPASQEFHFVIVQPVGCAVVNQDVKTWIEQDDCQNVLGSRITLGD